MCEGVAVWVRELRFICYDAWWLLCLGIVVCGVWELHYGGVSVCRGRGDSLRMSALKKNPGLETAFGNFNPDFFLDIHSSTPENFTHSSDPIMGADSVGIPT